MTNAGTVGRCGLQKGRTVAGLTWVLGVVAGLASALTGATPQRVVSLAPSLTELVCTLNACEVLVGVDVASNWPPSARRLPRVGDLYNPDLEQIVRLAPELIVSSPYGGALQRLRSLELRVVVIATDRYQDLYTAIARLGELLQRPAAAAGLAAKLRAQVQRVRDRVRALPNRRVYYEIDRTPYTAGGDSYVSALITLAGGTNIAEQFQVGYPRISPEFVLRSQPEVIILADAPHGVDAEEVAARPGWSSIPAVRYGEICALDQPAVDMLHRPGPRLGNALKVLLRCLHGEDLARSILD